MRLTVISPKGYPVMWTESIECFPNEDELQQLKQTRYKFIIDGKTATVKQIMQAVNK